VAQKFIHYPNVQIEFYEQTAVCALNFYQNRSVSQQPQFDSYDHVTSTVYCDYKDYDFATHISDLVMLLKASPRFNPVLRCFMNTSWDLPVIECFESL